MEASPLASLAPELRNQIYELTFTSEYATTLQSGSIQHALTKTCRQIRYETLLLYYSITRFNAHLDDAPALPLARCFTAIGPAHCLRLREVNIWDLHMLNATVLGEESVKSLMEPGPADGRLILQPLGPWLLSRGWYLKDVVMALHSMGLGLQRLCKLNDDGGEGCSDVQLTSRFALVKLPEIAKGLGSEGELAQLDDLMQHLGLNGTMRLQVKSALSSGHNVARIREGRRDIEFKFKRMKLISMQQNFIPHDEDFGF